MRIYFRYESENRSIKCLGNINEILEELMNK